MSEKQAEKTKAVNMDLGPDNIHTSEESKITFHPSETNEDEDFSNHLSAEERECLKYLSETIESFEIELLANSLERNRSLGTDHISDTQDNRTRILTNNNSTASDEVTSDDCTERKGTTERTGMVTESSSRGPQKQKPGLKAEIHQSELHRSHSDETSGSLSKKGPQTSSLQTAGPRRAPILHPASTKKFETLLRSGVSVQELRSQVLARLGRPSQEESTSPRETSGATSNHVHFSPGYDHKNPRTEALQKLGLTQRSQSLPSSPSNYPITTVASEIHHSHLMFS
nr:PREDICTED: uncharacterized protein LOC102362702 [Latimeria chalumnae]|eukprot:XP_006006331.1 PREDICTED: uncharacterized protein LOC102362702 [Latimeria chalumnae]